MKKIIFILALLIPLSAFSVTQNQAISSDGWSDIQKARLYFHNSDLQRQWAEHGITLLDIKPNDSILDFGSGDGKITASLSFRIPDGQMIGTDISEFMVNFANKTFRQENFKNLYFYQSKDVDFAQQDFIKTFDKIVSFCVFHFIPNPEKVLKNLANALKDDGKLLLVFPGLQDSSYKNAIAQTVEEFKQSLPPRRSLNPFSSMKELKEVKAYIENQDFIVSEINHIQERFYFFDDEEFMQWAKGTMSANFNLPKNIEDQFFQTLIKNLIQLDPKARTPDGAFAPQIFRIEVLASKKLPLRDEL